MSLGIININDAGIQIAVDGDLLRTSPGYAVLDDDKLMTGEEAARLTKLLPRWTNSRFWSQLSTAPLSGTTRQVRHHADIAFTHLEDLWKPVSGDISRAIIIVPGYFSGENLSLLLGMARECGIPVQGIVDASILAASNLPLNSRVLHLDIHLHSITLTRISNTGTLVRQAVNTIMETGLATLWDRWSTTIANQFIQSTRFDPMHTADSEQQLFNQLPGWITSLGHSNMHTFTLNAAGSEHNVAVSNESLLRTCAPLYPQIVQAIRGEITTGESASLLLSHHFTGFPGLHDSLGLIPEVDIIELGDVKTIGSANVHREEILGGSGSVSHILQLQTGEVRDPPSVNISQSPTHLLHEHQAVPVGSSFHLSGDLSQGPVRSDSPVCTLYFRNDELTIECREPEQVGVNGAAVEDGQILNAGDVLNVGQQEISLIRVRTDG